MSDTSFVPPILGFLRARYPHAARVSGAELGTELQIAFPTINLRRDFGGLRLLIGNHLSQWIKEIGRLGSDIEYWVDFSQPAKIDPAPVATTNSSANEFVPSNASDAVALHSPSVQSSADLNQSIPSRSLWSALTNPKLDLIVIWLRDQNRLGFASATTVADPTWQIAKITLEEHCAITSKFIVSRGLSVPAEVADPADLQSYIPRVSSFLRERGLIREWEIFRTDRILELLGMRLTALGATESERHGLLLSISASKARNYFTSPNTTHQSTNHSIATAVRAPVPTEQSLRSFVASAVSVASIVELRALTFSGETIEKVLAQR